eukprot:4671854-Pyramimonas_sp.AAC.1
MYLGAVLANIIPGGRGNQCSPPPMGSSSMSSWGALRALLGALLYVGAYWSPLGPLSGLSWLLRGRLEASKANRERSG